MNKSIFAIGMALTVFAIGSTDVVEACAMCGCRQRARKAEAKAYEQFHEHKGQAHQHDKDVRLDPSVPVVSTAGLAASASWDRSRCTQDPR